MSRVLRILAEYIVCCLFCCLSLADDISEYSTIDKLRNQIKNLVSYDHRKHSITVKL